LRFETGNRFLGFEYYPLSRASVRILTLVIAGRGQGQPARVLEDTGCGLGCMTLDRDNGACLRFETGNRFLGFEYYPLSRASVVD
jgi:hypothetical protein